MFTVTLAEGADEGSRSRRVGELDEEMVYESRVNDVFALGATSWRIQEITHDRVVVTPAFGEPARLPFWKGDTIGRPFELGAAIGEFVRRTDAGEAPSRPRRPAPAANLVSFLTEQREATGLVPTDRTLVVERFRDELGDWRVVLLSPFGRRVHAPWALAVGARIAEQFGIDGSVVASDDGIVARLPDTGVEPPGAELFLFEPDDLEEIVTDRGRRLGPVRVPLPGMRSHGRCSCRGAIRAHGHRCGSSASARRSCCRSPATTRTSRSCSRPPASASRTCTTSPRSSS